MFLRYRAKYYNSQTEKIEFGFFWAADYLIKNAVLDKSNRVKLEHLIHYFDHNLPIPEYYHDDKNRQKAKSATSWFKDSANDFIKRMNELSQILEQYNVEVERIFAKEIPGKKIYEDNYQITVIAYRDAKRKIE